MNDARFHQLNRGFLRWERCAGKPCQLFHSQFCRRLQGHESYAITIAQVMMIGNHHAVSQTALTQRSLEIGNAFVTVLGIVFAGAHRRGGFAGARLIFSDAKVGNLRLAVDHSRDHAACGVLRQFHAFSHWVLA